MEGQLFDMSKLHDSISEVITNSVDIDHIESTIDKANNNCELKENNKCININPSRELILDNKLSTEAHLLFTNTSDNNDLLGPLLTTYSNQDIVKRRHLLTSDQSTNTNSMFKKDINLDLSNSISRESNNNAINKYPIFTEGTPRRIKLISKKKEIASTIKSDGMTGIFKYPVKKIIEENLSVSLLKTQLKRTLTSCLQSPPVKRLATNEDSYDDHLHFSPISMQDILLLKDENKLQSLTYLNTIKNGRRIACITKTKFSNLNNLISDENFKSASKVRWCEELTSVCESILPDLFTNILTDDIQQKTPDPLPPDSMESQKKIIDSTSDIPVLLVNNVSSSSHREDQYFISSPIFKSPIKTCESNICDFLLDNSSTASEINSTKAIKPILNLNKLNKICPFNCEGSINVVVMQSRRQSSTFLSASII